MTQIKLVKRQYTGDLRLIKPPLPQRLATDLGPKFINPRPPDPRPHPEIEAPDAKTEKKR